MKIVKDEGKKGFLKIFFNKMRKTQKKEDVNIFQLISSANGEVNLISFLIKEVEKLGGKSTEGIFRLSINKNLRDIIITEFLSTKKINLRSTKG